MNSFALHTTSDWIGFALSLSLGIGLWTLYYGIECCCNGGTMLRCLKEEISWFLPGGTRRKGRYIKENVISGLASGVIMGWRKSWRYEAVAEYDLYEECGKDVLPGRLHFLIVHVVLPLAPLTVWFLCRG
jgi:hypothetical protein